MIRSQVEERLRLPPYEGPEPDHETAAEFWQRAEEAGQLIEAVALYDQLAAAEAKRMRVRRETKMDFADRIAKEGRRAEVEAARAELLAGGLSGREAQEELVARFQPMDGSVTHPWRTPNPWLTGRLFRRRQDQAELLRLANGEDKRDAEINRATWRVNCARWRQEERMALAEARQRAKQLKADALNDAGSKSALSPIPEFLDWGPGSSE
jgi:hypothetical protein